MDTVKKQDKVIRPGEMPGSQQPSGWQFPPKPGYDVIDSRGPGEIKEVGDMTLPIYPGALDGNVMGVDMGIDATNRLGDPDGRTKSDPSGVEPISIQHPAKADRINAGSNHDEVTGSVPMTGCGSDEPFDRFPESRRGKHDNQPTDD